MMNGKNNQVQNRREHYRLEFPVKARPFIIFGNKKYKYPIIDISIKGLRFLADKDIVELEWIPGAKVQGVFKLNSGPTVQITGKVLYTKDDYVVILFDNAIPLKLINDEQRYLIQHFAI